MTIRVATPDGGIAEFPDGTSPDIMRTALRAKFGGGPAKSVAQDISATGTLKQLGMGALEGVENAATAIGGGLNAGKLVRGQLAKLTGTSNPENAPKNTPEEFARTGASFVANPISYTGGGSVGLKVLTALTSALGSEGLRQLVKGQGPLAEGVASIVGAVLGGKVPSAAGRAVTPLPVEDAQHAARVEELRQFGVEPRAGDVSGSRALRRAEETLGNLPGAGGSAQKEETRIGQQLTDAVVREMGGSESTRDTDISEILANNRDRLQNSFESVAKRLPVRQDQQYINDINGLDQELWNSPLSEENRNRLLKMLDRVTVTFKPKLSGKNKTPLSIMSGDDYQGLTRKNADLSRMIDSNDPDISYYATRIRSALDDAMERTATGQGTKPGKGRQAALQELKDTRRQWYTMLVLSKAVASSGEKPAHGIITPSRLRALIANTDDNKIQYALQRSNLSRLSRSANAVLNPLPNSNTAERLMTGAGLGGIGSAIGATLGGAPAALPAWAVGAFGPGLTGRALLSGPVQGYLKNQAVGRLPPSAARSAAVAGSGTIPGTPTSKTPQQIVNNLSSFGSGGLLSVLQDRGINIPGSDQAKAFTDAFIGMPGVPWSEGEIALMKVLKSYGLGSKAIADRLGKTAQAVDSKISKMGLSKDYGTANWTPSIDRKIISMSRNGSTQKDIAKETGFSVNQIDWRIRQLRKVSELATRGTPSLPKLKFMEGPGPEALP